jgi:hypothetical protein
MTESVYHLRLKSPADKEIKTTRVLVTENSGEFTSQLAEGYTRKRLIAYNLSNTSSGEVYYGPAEVTALTGMPLKKGEYVDIPIGTDLSIYFVAEAGEEGDLRVIELA